MQNAHGLTITISPNVKIQCSWIYFISQGVWFRIRNCSEWRFPPPSMEGMSGSISQFMWNALFFSNLCTIREYAGGIKKKKKKSIEKNMRRKSWANLFFSCCVFPGPQGTPPATAIQTLYWSYFHWIIRTHLPLTGLWTSHLSTSRNSKKLQNSFQHDFHSATHGSGFQCSF